MIVTSIKKQPVKVPAKLWKILRKFSLARTPQEERLHLFASSEPVDKIEHIFGHSILRMLKSALLLDCRLKDIKIQVVAGGESGIDLLYREDEGVLLLHEKWLDFKKTHEEVTCDLSLLAQERMVEMDEFSCDHVVEDVFELIINDIRLHGMLDPAEANAIRRVARERIRQTPRRIKVSKTLQVGELEVSWMGNESGIIADNYGVDMLYDVTLHKASSCRQRSEELIHQDGMYSPWWCLIVP